MENTLLNLTTLFNVNADFADVLFIPFAHETSFNSLESAEMQFAFRKKVFDCMDTLHKHLSSLGVRKT